MKSGLLCLAAAVAIGFVPLCLSGQKEKETAIPRYIPIKDGEAAPKWSAPDSNPSSPTYKKKIAIQDSMGKPSIWIVTFDCEC